MERYGPPLSPAQVISTRSALIGRTILIDGYLGMNCQELGRSGCVHRRGRERFVVMGNQGQLNPDNPNRCAVGVELLLREPLPVSFAEPFGRRVLVLGTLVDWNETLPHTDRTGADATVISEFDMALTDVSIVNVSNDRCN